MVDSQEDTWMLARLWTRSGKVIACTRQETMLRSGASSATPVQTVAACEPGVWFLCISTMSGPPIREGSDWCSRALPTERPREPIPHDCYGLLYQVAGGLHHPQPRGFNCGRSPCDQLFLPLWSTTRGAQVVLRHVGEQDAPHPCTHSWRARSSTTSEQLRGAYKKSLWHTREIGAQGSPSSCLQGNHPWHNGLDPS
jgi:hypothetical protein